MANHDAHHDGHDHDHDHTEGNRQYYPKGWWIPLVALVVFAIGFAGLGGWLFSLSGTDRWGKHSAHDEHGHGGHKTEMAAHHDGDKHEADLKNTPENDSMPAADSGMVMTKLSDGKEISGATNGIESMLVSFINDAARPVDKTTWFTFDRLVFETGKSTLNLNDAGTLAQLDNMAAILKSSPNVALKIGGYTDNTGNKEANQKLSQQRAESVMAEIVKRGIAANRLAAEGYGDQFPKADNATEEGRAQNRRIDVRVTKK
ncbi:MAG: OmpA family protein [Bacteroidia bacterium]|jgi:outer membrane protein OmpA-like peptidoglycan-associated protein|nr:OmpA family protein [Bacteroidia bacterium]